jgi:hypothetical protein
VWAMFSYVKNLNLFTVFLNSTLLNFPQNENKLVEFVVRNFNIFSGVRLHKTSLGRLNQSTIPAEGEKFLQKSCIFPQELPPFSPLLSAGILR